MDLLDEEPQENFLKKAAKKNLRNSLIALVLLILSIVTFLIGADSVNNNLLSETLVVLFYGLMFIAVALAIITLISSFKAIRKSNKENKNYIAIGIAILILLAVINEVL